jgi:hypothetical protein
VPAAFQLAQEMVAMLGGGTFLQPVLQAGCKESGKAKCVRDRQRRGRVRLILVPDFHFIALIGLCSFRIALGKIPASHFQ